MRLAEPRRRAGGQSDFNAPLNASKWLRFSTLALANATGLCRDWHCRPLPTNRTTYRKGHLLVKRANKVCRTVLVMSQIRKGLPIEMPVRVIKNTFVLFGWCTKSRTIRQQQKLLTFRCCCMGKVENKLCGMTTTTKTKTETETTTTHSHNSVMSTLAFGFRIPILLFPLPCLCFAFCPVAVAHLFPVCQFSVWLSCRLSVD